MRIIKKEIYAKSVVIFPCGDFHFNSEAFDEEKFNNWLKETKEEAKRHGAHFYLILGDIKDNDRPSTRLLRKEIYKDRIEAYKAEDKTEMNEIKNEILPKLDFLNEKNCLGLLDGDHYRLFADGLTTTQKICALKNLPYLGDGQVIINLVLKRRVNNNKDVGLSFVIHARHGIGYNKKQGGTANRNEEFSDKFPEGIDFFVKGHSHNAMINCYGDYVFNRARNLLSKKNVWIGNTGSFRKGILLDTTDYAEKKEYGATNDREILMRVKVERTKDGDRIKSKGEYMWC